MEDNGVGFNEKNFERFERLNDNTKGNKNKGTGRIQYIHCFKTTEFKSVYKENNHYFERMFSLSGSAEYLNHNAILFYKKTVESTKKITGTQVVFTEPINTSIAHFYEEISMENLKNEFLKNYMLLFCNSKSHFPDIKLNLEVNNSILDSASITEKDIPNFDRAISMRVPYREKRDNNIIISSKNEDIIIQAFKIDSTQLQTNKIVLSAKDETVETNLKLDCISDKDVINNKRYMFILKSNYFDENVSNDRGKIELITEEEYKKSDKTFYDEPVLLFDDIQMKVNTEIENGFPEIKEKQNDILRNVEELKEMFLLNPEAIKSYKFTASDDDRSILSKIYKYDSDVMARKDAELKRQMKNLENLDTSASDYEVKLEKQVNALVSSIPIQNRTSLTQYIARRQLILKQFDLILKRKLQCQSENNRNKDEKLLHNLIFQQHSTDSRNSALWLLNEEFIYFSGISESRLCDIEVNGEKVFRQEITEKENEYLHEFGESREVLRPDILLFPEEHKAIIIEFKAPDVNVAKYLSQVQNYASLLLNFCEEKFSLNTFYGYLIGENIEPRDILHNNPYFKNAPKFDYLYLPAQPVVNDNGGSEGSMYMEVLKYSTLLKRAELRNQIYKEKLGIMNI